MDNYTITGTFVLPSLGKIYKHEIDPNVTLRTMTTAEEMRRMAQTDYPYRTMSEIIAECIVTGPDLHPYDMCIGDYLFLLYKLRCVTYGGEIRLSSRCPFCGHLNNDKINLNDLPVTQYTDSIQELFRFKLPQTGKEVELKLQTPRMLDTISDLTEDYRKKSNNKAVNAEIVYNIAHSIDCIDGKQVMYVDVEDWVKKLPMLDTQVILAHIEKINSAVGFNKEVEVVCDTCGLSHTASFRITNEFFRPTIDI